MFNAGTALIAGLVLLTGTASPQDRIHADSKRAFSAFSADKHRQFDFWIGEWDVNLRMLDENLQFQDRVKAHASIYSILHGKAILELWDSQPIKGYSLRYYDPELDKWVLWLNWPGKNRSGLSSLTGEFRHGRGEFYSEYQNAEGDSIIQRYAFNDITPFSLRWDDLISKDGGKTWRKNWLMEFTRTAVEPEWALNKDFAHTYDTGTRCDSDNFRSYESLAGHWHGEINKAEASISAWKILDGCAVMVFLDLEGRKGKKRFMLLTFDTARELWEVSYLDDDRSSGLLRLTSKENWTETAFENYALFWKVTGDKLTYKFTNANGEQEAGRFERQDLATH